MAHHAARWGKVLLPMVAHSAVKVRKRVLEVIESRLEMLLTNQREALAASLVPVFKSVSMTSIISLTISQFRFHSYYSLLLKTVKMKNLGC